MRVSTLSGVVMASGMSVVIFIFGGCAAQDAPIEKIRAVAVAKQRFMDFIFSPFFKVALFFMHQAWWYANFVVE
jgi:hypothetical protein